MSDAEGRDPADADLARRSAAAMWAQDAASAALGIELVSVEPGRARLRMRVTEQMVNGHEIAHGGLVFTLADSAFAVACNTHGVVTVAAGADVTFVAPARLGDVLQADATEQLTYGRSGVTDVRVVRLTDDGEQLVALFRGRSRSLGRAIPGT